MPIRLATLSETVKYVMMYSRCKKPHEFSEEPNGDILDIISSFFEERISQAIGAGISESQLVLDPGMGGFISANPENSWKVIREFSRFNAFGLPLYFGSSRKGFLKLPCEENVEERDFLTSYTGKLVSDSVKSVSELYIRVHNVKQQVYFLSKGWE